MSNVKAQCTYVGCLFQRSNMRNSCFSSIYFTFWTVCASEAYKSRAKPIYLVKQSATVLYLCPFQKNKSVASTAKIW